MRKIKIKKLLSKAAEKIAHKAIKMALDHEQKGFVTSLQARLVATVVAEQTNKLEHIEELASWVDGRAAALRSMAARS